MDREAPEMLWFRMIFEPIQWLSQNFDEAIGLGAKPPSARAWGEPLINKLFGASGGPAGPAR